MLAYIFSFLSSPMLSNLVALLVVVFAAFFIYRMHTSPNNDASLVDLFVNAKTGKIEGSKFRLNIAFLTTTWAMIFLTFKGNLTEWYTAAYLTAFVADRMLSRNGKENVKEEKTDGT